MDKIINRDRIRHGSYCNQQNFYGSESKSQMNGIDGKFNTMKIGNQSAASPDITSKLVLASCLNGRNDCECCRMWKKEVRRLNDRILGLEKVYLITPEVVNWFENLKLAFERHNQNENDFMANRSILSTSSFSLNKEENFINNKNLNYGEPKIEKNVVPEIVIEDLM